ncbi:MAG: DnaD domain protein [Clostridia bacterium]|nr:DnaD domain protein [Clostridia bacterium]
MSFCKYAGSMYDNFYTLVDNTFITQYMPGSPEKYVCAYVYGLYLAGSDSSFNDVDSFCSALNMTVEDVNACFIYWEELGLVIISKKQPLELVYQPVKNELLYKKIKPAKYREFNKQIQTLIEDRMINPNEFMEYYAFLEETLFEPEALVAVARYCVSLKGKDINGKYILAVARNLYRQGVRTKEVVEERLNRLSSYSDDALLVFRALKLHRSSDYGDRQLVEKWLKEYCFTMDSILFVAKTVKYGGMEALDARLTEYYRGKIMSAKEIADFTKRKSELIGLAKEINRTIGVYYQNVDFMVEEYLVKWLNMGFSDATLLVCAKYAFLSDIRTLNGFDALLGKLRKEGLTDTESINAHISMLAAVDAGILEVLQALGLSRRVNSNDRNNYKCWTEDWKLPHELVLFAAQKSANAVNPVAYLNRLLSIYKMNGITDVAAANELKPESQTAKQSNPTEVTKEQMRALIDSLED